VRLGPYAAVGKDCVLEAHSTVTNSVIFPGSYVGEGLELRDVIVDRNRLVNPRLGGVVVVSDNFLLASLSERHVSRWAGRMLARAAALVGLVPALPVLLLTALWLWAFRRGPVIYRKEAVRLPAGPDEETWQTFPLRSFCPPGPAASSEGPGLRNLLLRFLPALAGIARGDLSFVGVPPRTPGEVQLLPHDWRTLYLGARAGVVTEASLRSPAELSEDERYAAEAFYVATRSWKYDLRLLTRYLARCFLGFLLPARPD
jgi:lipopolysaccharide/colanic/teichoic acid biosynthesis glycosyltransferase